MGASKTQIFNKRQNTLANIFKALGHPARIAILQYVSRQQSCICNDIVEEVGLAQPTVSQHLKELKNMGLIVGEIEGKKVCYCLNLNKWNAIQEEVDKFFDNTRVQCC